MDSNPDCKYRPSLVEENPALLVWLLFLGAYSVFVMIAKYAWYIHDRQIVEFTIWLLLVVVAAYLAVYQLVNAKQAREDSWPNQLPTIPTRGERQLVERAWQGNAVVLGYDVHGKPWKWADETRVMQALVLGQTGSGKTTLLRNIITQDLIRRVGPPGDRHKIPMVIFDGKGDLEFFHSLLPYIHRAGRLTDLRLLNPSRPELSVQYNPFASEDDNYMAQVPVQKRTQQLWRKDFLGFERFQKATGANEREQLEYRALDHHIKNLGKGKMEILMTDPVQGTLHGRLHVRPPADIRVPFFEPKLFPKLRASRDDTIGANLRFKDQKLAAMIFPRKG